MSVTIQPDYWTGTKCVENEVPWQTPGSIHHLHSLLVPEDSVLEIGSGGSTLFFARRCRWVVAIETDPAWYARMQTEIADRKISNVEYLLVTEQKEIERTVREILARPNEEFTVASVDSNHGYDRSAFLDIVLENAPRLSVLVLDNYGERVLFSKHSDWTVEQVASICPNVANQWRGEDFNDFRWCGKGTRILDARSVPT